MAVNIRQRWLACLAMILLSSAAAAAQETPAEKIRKVLDQQITLNFVGQDLQDVANHLRDKTGIRFVVEDQQNGIGVQFFPPQPGGMPPAAQVEIKCDNTTQLKTALQRMLNSQHLTYVVLEDSVLIATQQTALSRQMGQRVSVRVEDVPLQKALKDLTRTTPVNLVIDPRSAKEAQNKVSLDVEGVTVETAVRLLAEIGGLKSVRIDNVLFVTSEARAEKLWEEPAPLNKESHQGAIPFGINGGALGMRIMAPAAPPRAIRAQPAPAIAPAVPPVPPPPPAPR